MSDQSEGRWVCSGCGVEQDGEPEARYGSVAVCSAGACSNNFFKAHFIASVLAQDAVEQSILLALQTANEEQKRANS